MIARKRTFSIPSRGFIRAVTPANLHTKLDFVRCHQPQFLADEILDDRE